MQMSPPADSDENDQPAQCIERDLGRPKRIRHKPKWHNNYVIGKLVFCYDEK